MSQHTPGPWIVDAEHAGLFEQDQARFWINASGTHVAYVDGPRNDQRTANAHLIASAPEMLAALIAAREFIQLDRVSLADTITLPDGSLDPVEADVLAVYDFALTEMNRVIAKATGATNAQPR